MPAAAAAAAATAAAAAAVTTQSSATRTFGVYKACPCTGRPICSQNVLHSPCGSEQRCPTRAGTHTRTGRPAQLCPCTRYHRCRPPICHLDMWTPRSHRHKCPGHVGFLSGAGPPGHAPVLAHLVMTAYHSPGTSGASGWPPAALLGPRGGHWSPAVLLGPEDLGTSSGVRVGRALGLTIPSDPDALPRSRTALRAPLCCALRAHTPHPAPRSSPRRTRRTARACPLRTELSA